MCIKSVCVCIFSTKKKNYKEYNKEKKRGEKKNFFYGVREL